MVASVTVTYSGRSRSSDSAVARYGDNSLLSLMVESGSNNVKRHWRRHIVRVGVLLSADLAAYAAVSADSSMPTLELSH